LQTVRHRFNIYSDSCVALALCGGDGHRKLVTRCGVTRREFNEMFGFYENLCRANYLNNGLCVVNDGNILANKSNGNK